MVQVGVLISYGLGPFLVHSDNTNIVCSGNATADMQYSWTQTIYSQLVYYLSGQVAVSLLFIIVTLIGRLINLNLLSLFKINFALNLQ